MDSSRRWIDRGEGGPEPSDADLARRVQRGDRDAFELLARRYLRPVHAVAASFLKERADVEDAAQETFMRALRAIGRFDASRPFAPWLYQIARNVARNRVAQTVSRRSDPMSDFEDRLPDQGAPPDSGVETAELRRLIAEAVAELPEQRRTAFRLADVEGYPAVEVARLMGLTPGAVRAHIHHARRDLRSRLEHLVKDGNEHDDERRPS